MFQTEKKLGVFINGEQPWFQAFKERAYNKLKWKAEVVDELDVKLLKNYDAFLLMGTFDELNSFQKVQELLELAPTFLFTAREGDWSEFIKPSKHDFYYTFKSDVGILHLMYQLNELRMFKEDIGEKCKQTALSLDSNLNFQLQMVKKIPNQNSNPFLSFWNKFSKLFN